MSETPQPQNNLDEENISSQLPSPTTEVRSNNTGENVPIPETDSIANAVNPNPVTTAAVEDRQVATEPDTTATPQSETQSMMDKLTELSNQRDAFQSQYLRIAADFDNFRKRSSKEREDIELQVKRSTIVELLSVVDNFERARTQIKPQNEGEMGIHKSYQGVYKQLVESLKRVGVSPMRPEGQQFDPNLHEAVMREPTEEHPEGTVIEELQRGYYLGDRILRHSLVKVAAPPEQLSAEDAGTYDATEG
jgi:molecular chaperone GrpE